MITELAPNERFVFGSNTAGIHGAGAALQAHHQFGAEIGIGEGVTGQCYAFPSLDGHFGRRSRVELEASRDLLYATCRDNPELSFLLTKVGTGLGGYAEPYMRSLFADPPSNLILPEDWR